MNGVVASALIAAPLLIPAIMGPVTLLFRRQHRRIGTGLSLASVLAMLVAAIALLGQSATGEVQSYALGDWVAPFGIVLVLDRLSALLLVLTAVLALVVLVHAILTGLDRAGWHFHPLFQFQLLGINGAFLTGDLFNLFVFFEVMLIASYGLMLHGQGRERLHAGVQYVVVNLVGSTIFLIAIGILYGITGTLNMADMAARAAQLPQADLGLLRAGAQVLILVFALKAALLPLHLWLPRTYAATSPVAAALFAIMTKVGAYAILRTGVLMFGAGHPEGPVLLGDWLVPAALATVVLGFIGLVAARTLGYLAAFGVVGSTGTLMFALALFTPASTAAALYYLPHTTLAAALLFLVSDLVIRARGTKDGALASGPAFPRRGVLAALFMLAAIALAGLPPLSGFIGKLLILKSALDTPFAVAGWTVILGTSVLAMIGLARAGSAIFWKVDQPGTTSVSPPAALRAVKLVPSAVLVALLAALAIWAGPVSAFADDAARQLYQPSIYLDAVLGSGEGG
jgi:multicomponent K+:H+ antiporter subunit D